ncbi:hypothetical protein QYE76_010512 [Lolium multiflorum]|uniref:Uncharacterized protein n=1 Tax=Lolium multiflorum TaxID=4521 RepID=A0AAD8X357_LOLMU|nr:hypothetical protein QYE76_010512 [Lolium multiflorum]
MSSSGLTGDIPFMGGINPYLNELMKHPKELLFKDGKVQIEDVSGPKGVGDLEARVEKLEQEGPTLPTLNLSSVPSGEEAVRVVDEFCDNYRALRKEVDRLLEENTRLRRMLEF